LEQQHKNVENMANINGKTIFINLELLPGNRAENNNQTREKKNKKELREKAEVRCVSIEATNLPKNKISTSIWMMEVCEYPAI